MNNTNNSCPPRQMTNGIMITDYRPNKALYTNVHDSNKFRKYLQENGDKLIELNRRTFETQFHCPSEMDWPEVNYDLQPYEPLKK